MKKKNNGLLLALPQLLGFLVFYFVPFLITVWYSVSFGIGKREFVGLDNFRELFQNKMFLLAVTNMCKYMLYHSSGYVGGCIVFGGVITKHIKRSTFFSTDIFVSADTSNCIGCSGRTVSLGK